MASNGLEKKATRGKCRICQRVRHTETQVKPVGEVRRGYATGHVWECKDVEDCNNTANKKLSKSEPDSLTGIAIRTALQVGRFTEYKIFT